jgi:hypothetical protein
MRAVWCGLSLVAAAILAGLTAGAEEPAAGEAVVTDVEGKEFRLTSLKFAAGARRLAWLADPRGTTEDEKKGPLALELREPNSTTLVKGVVTLVPLSGVESVRYDYEKQLVSVAVKGLTNPLTGTLEYKGINNLGLSGTADGKAGSFTGGILSKTAVKSAVFGGTRTLPRSKEGASWNVQIVQPKADNPTLTARNLKVLVAHPGGVERLLDGMPARKGEPVPFDGKFKRLELLANDPNTGFAAAEIETDGGPERIVAIPLAAGEDKKAGTLLGVLGEVDAGWKLFPLHTIRVITPSKRKVE